MLSTVELTACRAVSLLIQFIYLFIVLVRCVRVCVVVNAAEYLAVCLICMARMKADGEGGREQR